MRDEMGRKFELTRNVINELLKLHTFDVRELIEKVFPCGEEKPNFLPERWNPCRVFPQSGFTLHSDLLSNYRAENVADKGIYFILADDDGNPYYEGYAIDEEALEAAFGWGQHDSGCTRLYVLYESANRKIFETIY